MPRIHTTLKTSTNIFLIGLWGILAGLATFLAAPHSFFVAICGIVLGACGGLMQWLAFAESNDKFVKASTMTEIRKNLKATRWGRRYIPFLWAGNMILVAMAVIAGRGNPFLLVLSGYFSLMFARELVTLKPTLDLAKRL